MLIGRKLLRLIGTIAILAVSVLPAIPVLAIESPSSTPSIVSIHCFQNVLETGDFLIIVYENTPYTSVPDIPYGDAFIWRWIDTDNTTELARVLGYEWWEDGYGYNVISFYLNADNVSDKGIGWGEAYKLTLSGTPVAFVSPPSYTYDVEIGDYSAETNTTQVKSDIADLIILLAGDLDNKWSLSTANSLITSSETGVVLSLNGQAFFRGAIYGIQSMAPLAFALQISNIDTTPRSWSDNYTGNLAAQHTGDYIGPALTAGESMLDVGYNLFGLLLVVGICISLIMVNWYIGGGNLWRGLVESVPPLVIGARIGLLGLGELGLIAAFCWLYISAKIWRMI